VAATSLTGETRRRRAAPFARPARSKFKRHAVLFVAVNLLVGVANVLVFPDHVIFYYVTAVWAFILADNFLWAYVVDPDREVAERSARRAEREARIDQPNGENANDIDR
jgi:hypothetical protein